MYSLFAFDPSAARIVAYLDGLYPDGHASQQVKVNVLREDPHRPALHKQGETPPPAGGGRRGLRLRPFFRRTLTLSPSEASGMPSILDKAFKGEL
jgi:hypothetical protein